MDTQTATDFKLGDRVRILSPRGRTGKIIALLGTMGKSGLPVYHVLFRRKPRPAYTEVRSDQLELAPKEKSIG